MLWPLHRPHSSHHYQSPGLYGYLCQYYAVSGESALTGWIYRRRLAIEISVTGDFLSNDTIDEANEN